MNYHHRPTAYISRLHFTTNSEEQKKVTRGSWGPNPIDDTPP